LLTAPSATERYTLSLHDALPILEGFGEATRGFLGVGAGGADRGRFRRADGGAGAEEEVGGGAGGFWGSRGLGVRASGLGEGLLRSEEHTSELQSRENLVCRLLLE